MIDLLIMAIAYSAAGVIVFAPLVASCLFIFGLITGRID